MITLEQAWTIFSSVVAIASIIVRCTPTVKDDTILKSILKFTGKYLALNRTITPEEQDAANFSIVEVKQTTKIKRK